MEVYCRGTARIRHSVTGNIYEIECDELDWDAVSSDERQMGSEIHYEAMVDHTELGKLTWGLWEYPSGIENFHETNAGAHEVIKDFYYGLDHGEPDPDEWVDYSVPDDPFTIFMNSYHHTGDLLADHGSDSGGGLVKTTKLNSDGFMLTTEPYQWNTLREAFCAASRCRAGVSSIAASTMFAGTRQRTAKSLTIG